MKCRTGSHEWLSPEDSERCCNPAWRRVGAADMASLQDLGAVRIVSIGDFHNGPWFFGWQQVRGEESGARGEKGDAA